MISTSIILSTGLKKWMPMNWRGGAGLGQTGDRQGRGVGGEDRIGAHAASALRVTSALTFGVLEHRLDDQVAARQRGVIGGGGGCGPALRPSFRP
jgi:hypothetical protein